MVLLYVFGAIALINCAYFLLFSKFSFMKPSEHFSDEKYPVSLIVCAKNEAENLQNHLPLILNQDYPEYEIVLVNDASTDNTLQVLEHFQQVSPRLQVISILPKDKVGNGKKNALSIGIAAARYPYLLLTDADCFPSSKFWLQRMTQKLSSQNELVIGVSPYRDGQNLVSDIVAYETATTILQYIGLALWKLPYMGVGRNMAYTKNLFGQTQGFDSHRHISSGDDDLFVQEAILKTHVDVCLDAEAHTYSQAPDSWKKWWNQKVRHYTTGYRYQFKHQVILGSFILSKLLVYFLLIALAATGNLSLNIAIVYLVYHLVLRASIFSLNKKLQIPQRFRPVFFLDIIYAFTVVVQGIHSLLIKNVQWK